MAVTSVQFIAQVCEKSEQLAAWKLTFSENYLLCNTTQTEQQQLRRSRDKNADSENAGVKNIQSSLA